MPTPSGHLNAYPGLAPFQDQPSDRNLFFGRPKDVEALLNLVLASRLTLLFSRSGLGKTSLINAGVVQPLRERRFFPVMVRLDPALGPLKSVYDRVREAARAGGVVMSDGTDPQSLWEYFQATGFSRAGQPVRPVLILDQFEELFTLFGDKPEIVDRFVADLANLVRQRVPEEIKAGARKQLEVLQNGSPERERLIGLLYHGAVPDVTVLLSIREDYLPELQGLRRQIPNIFGAAMRLEPLDIEGAEEAIEKPAQRTDVLGDDTFAFAQGVVAEIVEFLRGQRAGAHGVRADTIEPVPLQVICRRLNEILNTRTKPGEPRVVTHQDTGGPRGMRRILERHYRDALRRLPHLRLGWSRRRFRLSATNFLLLHRPRAAARALCEKGLVLRGHRNSLMAEAVRRKFGLTDEDLSRLTDQRLLGMEPMLGTQFIELSHDTWVQPVRAYRAHRLRATVVSVLVVVALAVGGPVAVSKYTVARTHRLVNDVSVAPRVRVERFERSVADGDIAWSGARLESLYLAKLQLAAVDLRAAHLSGANLSDAILLAADLTRADLHAANLTRSSLDAAQLTQADLTEADLTAASLRGANLSGAKLSDAALDGADLTNAHLEGANLARTAWWLAKGLTPAQIDSLRPQFTRDSVTRSLVYRRQLKILTQLVTNASNRLQSMWALNNRAWFRATHGSELRNALGDVNRALRYAPRDPDALDTRGYILLELGDSAAALRDLSASLAGAAEAPTDPAAGERSYHLALAFDRMGEKVKAKEWYQRATDLKYHPTYEAVLTPRTSAQKRLVR